MNLPKDVENIISKIKNNPNVVAIYLFGSYAKNQQKPLSDIDIAVILDNITPELEAEIGSMYSNKIDLVLFHRLPLHIQYEVLKTGIPIVINNENKLKEIIFRTMRKYLDTVWLYNRIKRRMKNEVN